VTTDFYGHLSGQLKALGEQGLLKHERIITSPQRTQVTVSGKPLLNLCANNYLGLADDARLIASAKTALDSHGFGMASVRFICGTQDLHRTLEQRLSQFLGMEDTILFSSCWDANGGLFEVALSEEDAVISDALNHASIIDGIRLCKAKRFRYSSGNLADLEAKLKEAAPARFKLVVTDGVFSMDGVIADLKAITALAHRYGALVMVDDSHAVGFLGASGRGTHEHCGTEVDILTGTLGKALGGASGGYVSGKKPLIELLRQRARPYLFSNSLMPAITQATLTALDLIESGSALRQRLWVNAAHFRKEMTSRGFTLSGAGHPIIPVMVGDAPLAARFADEMLALGIYVVGFSYPVVPQGQARIRTQMSAAHSIDDLNRAISAFTQIGTRLGVIR
jgi:glycine C-acetyltransferase